MSIKFVEIDSKEPIFKSIKYVSQNKYFSWVINSNKFKIKFKNFPVKKLGFRRAKLLALQF
jgi:hypothetical protein